MATLFGGGVREKESGRCYPWAIAALTNIQGQPSVGVGGRASLGSYLALVGIMALALAVRLWAVSRMLVLTPDGTHYGTLARHGLEGSWRDVLDPAWPPLSPWLTATVARMFESGASSLDVERAGYLVSAVAGTLVLWPVWELARRWRGVLVAHIAIVLLAFHPNATRYAAYVQSDSVYLLLLVLAVLAFTRGASSGKRTHLSVASAGALAALAVLARPEGWVLVGVFALTLLRRGERRVQLLALLAPVALLLGPWLLFLHGELGEWSPGAKGGFNFHLAHEELFEAHGIEVEHGDVMALREPGQPWRGGDYRVAELLRAAPLQVFLRMSRTVITGLVDKLPSAVSWPLLLLGLYGFRKSSGRRPEWWSVVVPLLLLTVAFYGPFFVIRRFFLPFVPFFMIGAGAGLEAIGRRYSRVGQRGVAGLVLVTVALMLADTSRFLGRRENHLVYRDAGAWLRSHGNGSRIVLAGASPEPAFYGEVSYQLVLDSDPGNLLGWLRAKGATHFFLLTPGEDIRLQAWLVPGGEPDWLTDRLEFEGGGDRLVFWRVAGDGALPSPPD
ncbi:MAG: 4-amino-4-deoxy-L-arabinose transferase-like glycosyltransferase [Planctomycetota bacterium]